MYLSQVLLKAYPSLKWDQALKNKKFVDYGQPVLLGFGRVPLNPVGIVVSLAYGLVRNWKSEKALRGLFDVWSTLVTPD
jgi:hypothetical protein